MLRKQKEEVVAGMAAGFGAAGLMVVARHSGMTVAEMTDLRRRMRAAGAGFKVTKNRLAKLALEGTPFARIGPLFAGPTAVAFSADPVSAAKVVVDYANGNAKIAGTGRCVGGQGPRHPRRRGPRAVAVVGRAARGAGRTADDPGRKDRAGPGRAGGADRPGSLGARLVRGRRVTGLDKPEVRNT